MRACTVRMLVVRLDACSSAHKFTSRQGEPSFQNTWGSRSMCTGTRTGVQRTRSSDAVDRWGEKYIDSSLAIAAPSWLGLRCACSPPKIRQITYNNASAQTDAGHQMQFDEVKSDTLNLRVAPSFKATLRAVAAAEHRSMVNMLEVLLANYCKQQGMELTEESQAPRH
ncbi:conserved hypothetical protein [Cupriavidus taiwanensis]|nr:conserved hypothetical protein [Cupriavidus taiwanensis]